MRTWADELTQAERGLAATDPTAALAARRRLIVALMAAAGSDVGRRAWARLCEAASEGDVSARLVIAEVLRLTPRSD